MTGPNLPDHERFAFGMFNGLMASIVLWVLIALLFGWVVKLWADLPIVYRSASTNECVAVDDPAGEHECGNLPDKYELRWVE